MLGHVDRVKIYHFGFCYSLGSCSLGVFVGVDIDFDMVFVALFFALWVRSCEPCLNIALMLVSCGL